jgi:metal-responsive CopG/Arc/MetJ family transcriptional regulator
MQPKDRRLPLLLTEAELKAVDEWRFANKIPSRNEAVRMLIKLGLKTEAQQAEESAASLLASEIGLSKKKV